MAYSEIKSEGIEIYEVQTPSAVGVTLVHGHIKTLQSVIFCRLSITQNKIFYTKLFIQNEVTVLHHFDTND